MDNFTATSNEIFGCSLVESLEKNLEVLRVESRQMFKIDNELGKKERIVKEISSKITRKLSSLIKISELRSDVDKNEICEFVEAITLSWVNVNEKIAKEHDQIRVASRTRTGTSLTSVIEKVKKEAAAIKVSLEIGSVIYDSDYVARGYRVYNEISRFLDRLYQCDDKLQQYMNIGKMMPYLLQLSREVDDFLKNINSTRRKSWDDLAAFRFVSKLLTGELLALDNVLDPGTVLADSVPKKPVFITLNNCKRKSECSKIATTLSKIHRSKTFPPSVV